MEANQISWKRVIIFMMIGTIISNVFRFDVFHLESELKQLPAWIFVAVAVLLEGSGIFIGALIAIFLLKKRRETAITFFGTSKSKGLLMVMIPIIFLPVTWSG
jgi:Gpi18-like mannosyltransferase